MTTRIQANADLYQDAAEREWRATRVLDVCDRCGAINGGSVGECRAITG